MKIPWLGRKRKAPKAPQGDGGETEASKPAVSSVVAVQGDVVDSYFVPDEAPEGSTVREIPEDAKARILIVEKDNFGSYVVSYPELTPEQADALRILKENLEYYFPSKEAFTSTEQLITQYLWKTAEEVGILGVVQAASEKLRYYLLRDAIGFGRFDALFNDDNLEELSCVAWDKPVRVKHRKFSNYRFMETNLSFDSEKELERFVRRMAQLSGKWISRAQPSLEGTLPSGPVETRITATLGNEISRPGSTFTVRKQKRNPFTSTRLAATELTPTYPKIKALSQTGVPYAEEHHHKTLTALMLAYFWLLLEYKANILISGEPASGKTTLLNSLLALVNPNAKIVSAEDTSEILLPDNLHWERLVTRHAPPGVPSQARLEVDLAALLKFSLRFSPTVLSLGEMRGEESESVANAMTIGYSTICTVHAANTRDCITRMTSPPMKFSVSHIRNNLSAVVTMRRIQLPDLREVRRAVSVDETVPNELDQNAYEIRKVFEYHLDGDSFTPTAPEEVVERSYRLQKVAEYFGWTNEHLLASLTSRAAFIAKAISEGVFNVNELSERIRTYYAQEFVKELQKEEAAEG